MQAWCPKCDWYKGKQLQCPRCGYNEKTKLFEKLPEPKKETKKAPVKKKRKPVVKASKKVHISHSFVVLLLITGGILVYTGMGMNQKSEENIETLQTLPPIEDKPLDTPIDTPEESLETEVNPELPDAPNETSSPHELIQDDVTEQVSSGWTISSGTLSPVPTLHFIGLADFNEDGTYKIKTHPQEFDPIEGRVEYTGTYTITGSEVTGRGTSTIYQRGAVFGSPAVDTLTAEVSESGDVMEGQIISLSSLHSGGGDGNAIFTFVLEKDAQ